ncbi:MAG: polyprenyl synthetase family protein [Deferrisomatales bacterium]|nr:polyprenyl synthetase family protein [Deferrisomatales bacterium]
MSFDLAAFLDRCRVAVEAHLEQALPGPETFPRPLFEAMRYSLFAGGKRVRPAFCIGAAEAVGGEARAAVPFAAALEMIHTYSLIHDDLPAMDDDDLRRGVPTNHVVYGEGVAILAGDGLLTDAFAVLAHPDVVRDHPPERIARVVWEVARAAGSPGMVGGQVLDLVSEGTVVDLPVLEFLHTHKTGALIRASTLVGALAGGGGEAEVSALTRFAERIGLAFQIADDVLDVEGATETLGKPVGSDQGLAKATYPALLGLAESKRRAWELMDEGLAYLEPLGAAAEALRALGRFVVERRH